MELFIILWVVKLMYYENTIHYQMQRYNKKGELPHIPDAKYGYVM